MKKYNWNPVEEMDLDDGTHTCYAAESDGYFVYLTQISDGTWDVEQQEKGDPCVFTLANCKTLASARRWVSRYW